MISYFHYIDYCRLNRNKWSVLLKHGYFHFGFRTVDENTVFVTCRSHLL